MKYLLKRNSTLFSLAVLMALLWLPLTAAGQPSVDHYLAGRACILQERFDSAAFHLETALKERPGDAEYLYHLGVARYLGRNYPAAREAFYEAERRRTGLGSLYLARIESRLNRPEQAFKYLRIHLTSRYRVEEHEILLDQDLTALHTNPGWQRLWNEEEWYGSREQAFREAIFMKERGDYLEAINQLNELEKSGHRRSDVQLEMALIYDTLGNRKAARSALRDAVKSDVRNLDALYRLSLMQLEAGDREDALMGLDRLLRQDPARFRAYLDRAEARGEMGDLEGAMEDTEIYLTYFPGDDRALYRRGIIQFNNGKYLNAIQSFNRALELNKGRAEYYFARGRTYAATGTIRYAERDMSMALDLSPLDGEVWYEKGKLSERLGDLRGACHCYRRAYQYGVYEAREYLETRCRQSP